MARVAYIAEIDPREVAALGYLAGMLTGQGVPQGSVLGAILDRIQLVEVPDDFGADEGGDEQGEEPAVPEQNWEGEGGAVLDFPTPEAEESPLPENATEVAGGELPAIDPATDPTSPESLGIRLNLPSPGPPPVSTFGNQEDFGAGPPPRD